MRILILVGFLTLINCNHRNATNFSKTNNSFGTATIIVQMSGNSAIALQYLDTLYRNTSLEIKNRTDTDIIVKKEVHIDKPTVFLFNEYRNPGFFNTYYILEPGDSLFLSYKNNELKTLNNNSKNSALEIIYGKRNTEKDRKEFSFINIQTLIDSAKNISKLSEKRIADLSLKNNWSKDFSDILIEYNRLNTYHTIFKINYNSKIKNNSNLKLLETVFKEVLKEKQILDNISCPQIKSLLFYMVSYSTFRNNYPPKDLFETLALLDTSFHKKKYLDGFIYDVLVNNKDIATIKDRQAALIKLDNILFNKNDFFKSSRFQTKGLGENVLNSPFEDLNNNRTILKNLIKKDKKITLIDFWASWCVPCIEELPYLRKIKKKFSTRINILTFSIDEDEKKWKAASKKFQLTENSYRNLNGKESELVRFLELYTIPRYILINAYGQIIEDDFYRPSNKKFEIELENILSQ